MSTLFEQVRMRYHNGGLEFDDDEVEGNEDEGWSGHYCIRFPCGRDWLEIYLSEEHEAMRLLEQPFEWYRGVQGYRATWSEEGWSSATS